VAGATVVLAHVAGIPVEEVLSLALTVGGLASAGGGVAWLHVRSARTRLAALDCTGDRPGTNRNRARGSTAARIQPRSQLAQRNRNRGLCLLTPPSAKCPSNRDNSRGIQAAAPGCPFESHES
jgi:hypothetical protein